MTLRSFQILATALRLLEVGSRSTPFDASLCTHSPDLKGISILDHPLELLAFLHFQSRRQWRRANEIILAILTSPLNYLQFG